MNQEETLENVTSKKDFLLKNKITSAGLSLLSMGGMVGASYVDDPLYHTFTCCSLFLLLKTGYSLCKEFHFENKIEEKIQNSIDFQSLQKLYTEVLKETSLVLHQLRALRPMEIYAVCNYMIKMGYLSENHQFLYESTDTPIHYLEGVSLLKGQGQSMEMSSFLKDILQYHHYNSTILSLVNSPKPFVTVDAFDVPTELLPKRKKRMKNLSYGTLVLEKDTSFLLDPYQDSLLVVGNRENICRIGQNEETEALFAYEEDIEVQYEEESTFPLKSSLEQIEDLTQTYTQMRDICPEYEETFRQFWMENVDLFREITYKGIEYSHHVQKLLK